MLSLLLAALPLGAQVVTEIPQTKFSRGQAVVPVYEGWLANPDGTFSMVFGYFNRNWQEEPLVPAGPSNFFSPGEPDRGQPTFFLPRRQAFVFRVQVPKDWGQKELVWTLTAGGKSEKAYGQLIPEYEMFERMIQARGNLSRGDGDPNRPPSIQVTPMAMAERGVPVRLSASVTDDGLPRPLAPRKPDSGSGQGQSNSAASIRRGLSVSWMQLRGPAKAAFEASGPVPVSNGQSETAVVLPEPGTYVLRATASDGALSSRADFTVSVK